MESIERKPAIKPLGDSAVTLEWGAEISLEINLFILESARLITSQQIKGVIEVVPAYRTITVFYSPFDISYEELRSCLGQMVFSPANISGKKKNIVNIPVVYGGEYGPDLTFASKFCKMSIEEFIAIHALPEYLVYMIGFMPGFPYLGGLDDRLRLPRFEKPRTAVPQGAVGIGGEMTGIYPLKSPGGWHIIGRTPLKLFNRENEPAPFLLKAGDYVKFVPIDERSFSSYEQC